MPRKALEVSTMDASLKEPSKGYTRSVEWGKMTGMAGMKITFEIPDEFINEAKLFAAEMGLSLSDMAESAFLGYLEGVREARVNDADEGTGLAQLPSNEPLSALEGTEVWLDDER